MNKVLMSHSVIFKQQSANVVQRSQLTFSRLQCIMYDWTKKKTSSGLARRSHTCTNAKIPKEKENWKNNMHQAYLHKPFILNFSQSEGRGLGQTQIYVPRVWPQALVRQSSSLIPDIWYLPDETGLQTQSWEKWHYLLVTQESQVSRRQAHQQLWVCSRKACWIFPSAISFISSVKYETIVSKMWTEFSMTDHFRCKWHRGSRQGHRQQKLLCRLRWYHPRLLFL